MVKVRAKTPLYIVALSLSFLALVESQKERWSGQFHLNLSSSLPVGIYRTIPEKKLESGDLALFHLPSDYSRELGQRDWIPKGRPLLKPALAASSYCQNSQSLTTAGKQYPKFKRDYLGKTIPSRTGCFQLKENEFLAVSNHSSRSFDSRYFGKVNKSSVLGVLKPVIVF